MKKRLKILLTVAMIPVLLLSTSGFTLIHHHCTDCGLQELHFSMFEKDQDFECNHSHDENNKGVCNGDCKGACEISLTEENHNKSTCCSNEFEFHKLSIPLVTSNSNDIDFSPLSIDLFFFVSDFFSNLAGLFESDFTKSDSSPPEKYFNQSINILFCTFTC